MTERMIDRENTKFHIFILYFISCFYTTFFPHQVNTNIPISLLCILFNIFKQHSYTWTLIEATFYSND